MVNISLHFNLKCQPPTTKSAIRSYTLYGDLERTVIWLTNGYGTKRISVYYVTLKDFGKTSLQCDASVISLPGLLISLLKQIYDLHFSA